MLRKALTPTGLTSRTRVSPVRFTGVTKPQNCRIAPIETAISTSMLMETKLESTPTVARSNASGERQISPVLARSLVPIPEY